MRKYYQLILVVVCFISIITLLIYRHEYYRLRYVLEVLNFFGKPGLSEVEFCGPGFNATMLSEILRNSSMEVRETPPLFQQIDENFYSYSSFLRSYYKYEKLTPLNAHIINTIVIGKANVAPNFRCNVWLENSNKPKAGRFNYKLASEPIKDHRLFIFECSLGKNMGKPTGVSFYINDYNINPMHAPINKIIQVNTKRKTRESGSIRFINNIEPAVCVIPNHVPIVSRDSFIEFLVFHHIIGVDYFTIYDSMISEDVIRRLNLFPSDITQWEIQFFPLNYPFVFSKSYEIVRNAIELDCLFRHFRYDKEESNKVSHVAILSWDEFLVPRVHTNLKAMLDDFDPTRSIRTYIVESLVFCLNQMDDDNAEIGYPDIMKKTHYYSMQQEKVSINIRNLDTMASFEDLFNLNTNSKNIPLELLGAHKYSVCRDHNKFHPEGYNETEMQVFQHKFEGAMIKFGQTLVSNKIYRLYRSGQIWERSSNENVRDML
ncbi:jg12479 [Pararge aegeria aegeria]|uniref:Jg12479 protein n=2 Tax=Pararge aegeria TaxID=116150 RepID=A0A8S4RQ50_9NEOP|nr:jg12479 [Pararge aegeria aegeria]